MFINDFYRAAVLGDVTARKSKTYPRCALTYDCVCSTDMHCAEGQKCTDMPLPANKTAKICLDIDQQAGLLGNVEALIQDFERHF